MSEEFYYIDEAVPFTEEDWKKCMKVFGQRRRQNELYGSWLVETEQERKLRDLAETYHTGCDAYDRQVCTGVSPRTGEAIPLTPHESGLINRHAREMRETIVVEGESMGFSRQAIEEAIRRYYR